MTALIDLMIALVLAYGLYCGARRGLVLTVCALMAVIVAFAGAGWLTTQFVSPIAKELEPRLTAAITSYAAAWLDPGNNVGFPDVQAVLSRWERLGDLLRTAGLYTQLSERLCIAIRSGVTTLISNAAGALCAAMLLSLLRMVGFVVGFSAIVLICSVASRQLNLITHLPVVHQMNGLGGGFAGLAVSGTLIAAVVWVLGYWDGLLSPVLLTQSRLLRFFLLF